MILGIPFESVQGRQALSRVDGEIGDFGIMALPTRVPVEFQCETGLLLRCDGNVGIPFQTKQGNRPSSRVEQGKRGLLLSCSWKLSVALESERISREALGFHKGCQVPFRLTRGNVGFLRKCCIVKGPHLT